MMHNLLNQPLLTLNNISKRFKTFSIENISFSINPGDYFILLGMSGAGKSIVLETLAGLVSPDSGSLMLNGRDITNEKIQNRRIGLVFQDLAIFPHLSVSENIAYPLRSHSLNAGKRKRLVEEIASALSIDGLMHRRPSALSGGELQRVALARALVQKPDILLLDEPLASLDILLKAELRSLLRQINREGQTVIHVTHDYEEALSLGNKIAVMHKGKILQTGTPAEVFAHPKSEFVAHFTGARNFFRVSFPDDKDTAFINEDISIRIASTGNHGNGYILIKGEDIFLSNTAVQTSAMNNFEATIREIVPAIAGYEVMLDVGIPIISIITAESLAELQLEVGKQCYLHFKASATRFISE